MHTSTRANLKKLTGWIAAGATLIALGFAVDGLTEVGHHAFLILGGIAVGFGAARETRAG
jgi:hypothetical protein